MTANNTSQVPSGFQATRAGDGDPLTGLGKYSKHEKALKVNPNAAAAGEFWVVVAGTRSAIPSSVVLKKGSTASSRSQIDGPGDTTSRMAPVTEDLTHEGVFGRVHHERPDGYGPEGQAHRR